MSGIQLKLPTGYAITLNERRVKAAKIRGRIRRRAQAVAWNQAAEKFFEGV
ncbi:hypothetical protein ACFTWH_08335 [Streptomyces sp. NPDC057011]|uniref:hypothetical protein n=1 Tax=unclassified Streptomyces TaxID=2593676 RepID=UPI00362C1DF9